MKYALKNGRKWDSIHLCCITKSLVHTLILVVFLLNFRKFSPCNFFFHGKIQKNDLNKKRLTLEKKKKALKTFYLKNWLEKFGQCLIARVKIIRSLKISSKQLNSIRNWCDGQQKTQWKIQIVLWSNFNLQ